MKKIMKTIAIVLALIVVMFNVNAIEIKDSTEYEFDKRLEQFQSILEKQLKLIYQVRLME